MFLTRARGRFLFATTVAGASVNQVLKHISKRIHRPDNLRGLCAQIAAITGRLRWRFTFQRICFFFFVRHAVVLRGLTGANGAF